MTVYANSLEVSCKAQANKVIAAFPDVCFTPPQTPATPPGVPIPYPSFGLDGDTDKGSSTVKIGGKTISLKNKSNYKKTTGTEAGSAPKKGIISSKNTGKEYAVAWSSNVKVEGEPVTRMTDMTTNNHSNPSNGSLNVKIGIVDAAFYSTEDCLVGSYEDIVKECSKAGGEAHHIVPDKCFRTGTRKQAGDATKRVANAPTLKTGMCICLSEENHDAIHSAEKSEGGLKWLGRPDEDGLSRREIKEAKDAMRETGDYGVADVADVYNACEKSLDDLDLPEDCIEAAKEAITEQSDEFEEGQILRTSSSLPNKKAIKKMKKR
ncbi:MAG: DUF4150 domain-containing protein [Pseudomonadota bacterium]